MGKAKDMKKITILLIALMLISVGVLSGCIQTTNQNNKNQVDFDFSYMKILGTHMEAATGHRAIIFIYKLKNIGNATATDISWYVTIEKPDGHRIFYEKYETLELTPTEIFEVNETLGGKSHSTGYEKWEESPFKNDALGLDSGAEYTYGYDYLYCKFNIYCDEDNKELTFQIPFIEVSNGTANPYYLYTS